MSSYINTALYILSSLMILYFALSVSSLFKFKSVTPYILSIYLLSFANIVLISEVGGILNLVNRKWFFLSGQLILVLLGFILWRKYQSPSLFAPLLSFIKSNKTINLRNSIRKDPLIWILGLSVFVLYCFGLFLILYVAPNNYDSMTCHMTRVAYWLQYGNFLPWKTWNVSQQVYPINAQVQIFWSVLFLRSDIFAGLTQFTASIMASLAIYGISRQLGWTRPQSLFAGFIYLLFPEILLQSTTTQNHLTATALIICSFYFLFVGFSNKTRSYLIPSSLSMGMALGTHQIAFFVLPGLFVTILVYWLKERKVVTKLIMFWSISCIIMTLLLGSYKYFMNYSLFGHPFNEPSKSNEWMAILVPEKIQKSNYWTPGMILMWTKNNVERYIHTSLDLTGLPPSISEPIYNFRDKASTLVFNLSNNPLEYGEFKISRQNYKVSEDFAWFGLVGFLLFYPLVTIHTLVGLNKNDPIRIALISTIVLYTLIWAGLITKDGYWSKFAGRFFVVAATLFAPFIASIYKKGVGFKLICIFFAFVSVFSAVYTTIYNQAKPLTGDFAIWKIDRTQMIYANAKGQADILSAVDEIVPSDASLGILLIKETFDYPFFGKNYSRKLFSIYPDEMLLEKDWNSNLKLDWLLLCKPVPEPTGFKLISTFDVSESPTDQCRIYQKE